MTPTVASFADLLQSAVTEPGTISAAYRQFHTFSFGNQLLAWSQCAQRDIQPSPLATFPKRKALGRYVRKGEKALVLCQPVTIKRTREQETESESTDVYTRFVYRPAWFVLAQTEGADLPPVSIALWNKDQALGALDVADVPFDATDGNVRGSPVADRSPSRR